MNGVKMEPKSACRLIWVLVVALLSPFFLAAEPEQILPVLVTRNAVYTNVTVTTKTKEYVFILHSTGMANVKVADLSPETRQELGFGKAEDSKAAAGIQALSGKFLPQIQTTTGPIVERIRKQMEPVEPFVRGNPQLMLAVVTIVGGLYLFFCFCCRLICIKARKPASALIWVPVFQFIPLLRAAGMSAWWVLAYLVPVLNLVVHILWSFQITKARGKAVWIGMFLILPITLPGALMYLAFSSEAETPKVPRFESMALPV
jgi:hypothetical protein